MIFMNFKNENFKKQNFLIINGQVDLDLEIFQFLIIFYKKCKMLENLGIIVKFYKQYLS